MLGPPVSVSGPRGGQAVGRLWAGAVLHAGSGQRLLLPLSLALREVEGASQYNLMLQNTGSALLVHQPLMMSCLIRPSAAPVSSRFARRTRF